MFNPNKAGLEAVDKAEVDRIIEEISKGTPFWDKRERQKIKHQEKITKILTKLHTALEKDRYKALKLADDHLAGLKLDVENVFVHVDMDAFYASVEERDNPELIEKPMAVGGKSMICTSNYVARKFGVRAGLPGFIGLKLCPQLILVPVDHKKYTEASQLVMNILEGYDKNLSVYGLDEASLNITEYCRVNQKNPEELVNEIRREVKEITKLTCSAGIGPNRMLAKIFADVNKPDGQFFLGETEKIHEFMAKAKIRKVPGIGEFQEKILLALGCKTCGDFIKNRANLFLIFSEATAKQYLSAAKGIGWGSDKRPDPKSRSKSAETTFKDTDDLAYLSAVASRLCDRLCEELQACNKLGKLITLRYKTSSYDASGRSVALEIPTNKSNVILAHINRLLKHAVGRHPTTKYRLLGVKLSNLVDDSSSKQITMTQFVSSTAAGVSLQEERPEVDEEDLFSEEESPPIGNPDRRSSDRDDNPDAGPSGSSLTKKQGQGRLSKSSPEASATKVQSKTTKQPPKESLKPSESAKPEIPAWAQRKSDSDEDESNGPLVIDFDAVSQSGSAEDQEGPEESNLPNTSASSNPTRRTLDPKKSSLFKAVSEPSPLVDETFCPVCGVILQNISSKKLNLHINKCLDDDKKKKTPPSKSKAPGKRKSDKRDTDKTSSIKKFFK